MNWPVPSEAGVTAFLDAHPRMARRPGPGGAMHISGRFAFVAEHAAAGIIADAFDLRIVIPTEFPAGVPSVTEVGGRIPRNGEYHVNSTDHTLCLGSPIGLLLKIARSPSLLGFAESCLVPYLYAVSHKLVHGGAFLFGELAHGASGVAAGVGGISTGAGSVAGVVAGAGGSAAFSSVVVLLEHAARPANSKTVIQVFIESSLVTKRGR